MKVFVVYFLDAQDPIPALTLDAATHAAHEVLEQTLGLPSGEVFKYQGHDEDGRQYWMYDGHMRAWITEWDLS